MIFGVINPNWPQTFATFESIMWFLIFYMIFLVIMALFLKIAIGFFKEAENKEFGKVFATAFIITVIYIIVFLFIGGWLAWIIVLIVAWIIISSRHKTGFLGAIVITVIAFILFVVVALLLGFLLDVLEIKIVLPF
ncbi:MAG: hypothetical protein ACTSRI_12610 [Promethearchaeota archaeon]